jgi:glutamine amidotransferase
MIAIIDYQMGNLRSVQKGFERVGHAAIVTDDPAVLADAERIVLPGVGAFEDAMAALDRRKLIDPILAAIDDGRPFLGICLGLQLLFDVSYEHGKHRGLGVVAGEVVPFELPREYKVPHMGWNALSFRQSTPLLAGLDDGVYCYFVHSFYVVPKDESVVAAVTDYHQPFCSVIARDNLYATQFHPEKSQADGLRILKNFAELPT